MKKIDLINWTIQKAQNLPAEPRDPSNFDVIPPLDEFLAMMEGNSSGPAGPGQPSALVWGKSSGIQINNVQHAVESPLRKEDASELPAAAQTVGSICAEELSASVRANPTGIKITGVQLAPESPLRKEAVVLPKPDASEVPAAAQTASSALAEKQNEAPQPGLLTAIIKPDIHTAPVDRDRAIALRWLLRDIKGERLNWLPVDQNDLKILMKIGLVEMQNDLPVLTKTGARAIA
jgi:hypothetical protein